MTTEKQIEINNEENKPQNKTETHQDKGIIKKDNKTMIKKYTIEEAKDLTQKFFRATIDPDEVFRELGETVLPEIANDRQRAKELCNKASELLGKGVFILGLENHYPLSVSVSENYKGLVVEFSRQLIKEYNCQVPSEKALAEVVVGDYIRILEYSRRLNTCGSIEFLSNEKNGYYSMLGKELDRAHRHFIIALTTLRQLKAPPLEVNIKSKTAFVAQNQQLNINPPNTSNKVNIEHDGNINPK